MRWVVAWLVALACSGCLSSPQTDCGGGIVCPLDRVCAPSGEGCILPEQLSQCVSRGEGAACSFTGTANGVCHAGVCRAVGCGDGFVTAPEQCEGSDLANATCRDAGFYLPDGLACNADCTFDTSQCHGYCGDGVKDAVEACDGNDLGGVACTDVGYYGGTLGCTAGRCTFDLTGCTGRCGDGTLDPAETCEPGMSADCTTLGFYSGGPAPCGPGCNWDVSVCTGRCGDGVLNGPEDCDDGGTSTVIDDVYAGNCQDLGYYQTTVIACNANCTYDASLCQGWCG